jgi:hypothetical protein
MKTLITIILSLSLLSFDMDTWEIGFYNGYTYGWCYQQQPTCISPVPPVAPTPTIYEDNSYEGGYARGFSQAIDDRDEN